MPNFAPDQVAFKDIPGYGVWDVGHAREHKQFVSLFQQAASPVFIPDFDFLQFLTAGSARKSILQTHANAHLQLRASLGLTGTDLSVVNLDSQDDFYNWLGIHATEHALIRQQMGIM